ncbi:MAG: hypothetical protein AB1757_06835 [Acidobacteriota bacterium]
MKKRKYYKLLKLGLFPYDILVCQGMELDEVRVYLERKYHLRTLDHEAWEPGRVGKTLHFGTNQTILWLKNAPTNPSGIATLAHEALHSVIQIYQTMGIPFNADNDEVVAYGVEYIVEQVLRDFRKQ